MYAYVYVSVYVYVHMYTYVYMHVSVSEYVCMMYTNEYFSCFSFHDAMPHA